MPDNNEMYEGAEAFVEVLNANGVENIFFNPGGEQAVILAAISKLRTAGRRCPRLVLCLDESVAMSAAHGHYMISGKPQVVMVHAELGTMQVGGALHNAQWGRVPIILWAGIRVASQRVNWKNEPYDQGLMVRNAVKWDHEIKAGEDIHGILDKAFEIALTEPRGPVYVCYPRDLPRKKYARRQLQAAAVPGIPPIDMASLDRVAELLIQAKKPLILAGATGRYPESVYSLIELAETLAAPVLTSQVWMNFPTTHPLCAGIEQILGSRKANPYMAEADVILAIDYDMPYALADGLPRPDAKIVNIGTDPLSIGRPLWDKDNDIFIKADSREAIPALNKVIREKLTPRRREEFSIRFTELASAHRKMRDGWHTLARSMSKRKPISPDWLCRCIGEVAGEDAIVLNHTIKDSTSVTEQIDRVKPGTLLGCAAGSIQWSLGAAFGAKIAAPDKTVVSVMTDGGFVWGCPVATLWSAKTYKAPFLSVILDNQGYGYMKQLVHKTSGEEVYTDRMAFEAGVDFMPPPDFAMVAESCGAWGKRIEDPADILPALKEALNQMKNGRPAVLDVRIERD